LNRPTKSGGRSQNKTRNRNVYCFTEKRLKRARYNTAGKAQIRAKARVSAAQEIEVQEQNTQRGSRQVAKKQPLHVPSCKLKKQRVIRARELGNNDRRKRKKEPHYKRHRNEKPALNMKNRGNCRL